MIFNLSGHFGMNKESIKKFIDKELDKNSDILIGVDDPEVNELVNILVDAVSRAIEDNNLQLTQDIEEYIDKKLG